MNWRVFFSAMLVANLVMACATIRGVWSGDAPTRHTCVVTSACHSRDAITSDESGCIKRGDQGKLEGELMSKALGALGARGCGPDARAWASCWNDGTPCTP